MKRFAHHDTIIKIINDNQIKSFVEVGVWYGWLALNILRECKLDRYIGVDPWLPYDAGTKDNRQDWPIDEWDKIAEKTTSMITSFANANIVRQKSLLAKDGFESNSIDMVFIDGDHDYQETLKDITAWNKIARRVICGHDYSSRWPGVKRAVHEVFGRKIKIAGGSVWMVFK